MRYLLTILLSFCFFCSFGEETAPYDSSKVMLRKFSVSSIDKYREDKDFKYRVTEIEQPSIWERFWMWFWQQIDKLMSTEGGKNTVNAILIVFGVAALVFLVIKINKMNRTRLFSSAGNNTLRYTVEEENIHTIDFEREIAKAMQNGNYRTAIRLQYLQTLKFFADRELIAWMPNKTNTDYIHEIDASAIQRPFIELTYLFEHAWYGNEVSDENSCSMMRNKFSEIKNELT